MGSLNYAFHFVIDVHIKITNLSGVTAKFSQDSYKKKNAHTVNIYHHEAKTIRYNTEDLDAQ